MKIIVLLVALLGLTYTGADSTDGVNYFIWCTYKAIDDGIPSIPIPKHNPLVIRNISFELDQPLLKVQFNATNNVLYDLLNATFKELNVTDYHDPEKVKIDYDLYWPLLNLTGDYSFYYKVPFVDAYQVNGSYNILLEHTDWTGYLGFVEPGQANVTSEVDEFTLASAVKSVEVSIDGFNGSYIESTIQEAIYFAFNNFPSSAAETLRVDRFNEYWLGSSERMQAIFDNCKED
ncbi:uncharacterized protein LOC115880462 [Sitophilus oryzae]|uniref:Uncharacterized protein LOC115880462 n=1 Tax=Sitophilus oryzae TaxID=7048 RepID=A0A6J2XSD1_SITOR|nr:uncharacterized protein LOC115880462 [Sitophilus oryzae]